MLRVRSTVSFLVVAVFFILFPAFTHGQSQGQLLPTGMRITPLAPAGATLQSLNPGLPTLPSYLVDMTVTTALSPDGKTLLILTSGFNQNLDANGNVDPNTSNEYVFVFNISGQTPRQAQVIQIVTNAFDGLAWNPNGKSFYVSGGPNDLVHVFNSSAGGTWQEGTPIPLNHNGAANGWNGIIPVAAGLDVAKDGRHLLVANYENDSVSAIDLSSGSVLSEFDLRPGIINPAKSGTPGGTYPYWVAIQGNQKAYVSSQRDREIEVLDISSLPAIQLITRIPLPGQPNKMILNREGTRLFVAQDNVDSVAIIDTHSDRVLQEVGTIAPPSVFPNTHRFKGAGPNSLALSPDERTLYVTNGGANSVAVIQLLPSNSGEGNTQNSSAQIVGLIPTAWYPTSVTVSRNGSALYVVNGKSLPGPNPKACIDTAAAQSDYGDYSCSSNNQYIYQIMHAGFAVVPTPGEDQLKKLTIQVARNDHFRPEGDFDDDDWPSAAHAADKEMLQFLHQHIQHVLFVVKENKTYDQVLGDLEKGKGDPSLVSLPEIISPNHHKLARQFVTLDNTFCSGEVSGDGWNWSAAARVTDMQQKTIQLDYTYAIRAPIYDFDGTNRNINVGLPTLAARLAANPEIPDDPNILAGTRDVAEHDSEDDGLSEGYIWDAALRANKTVRNYGFEYIDLNRYFLDPSDPNYVPPLRNLYAAGVVVSVATKPSLEKNTDPYYRGWDMAIADYWLFKEWEREFDQFSANNNLPSLELIALPHDHFGDTGPGAGAIDGVDTIETQMADNDYALALLVQKVANSRFKNNTLIFVIEDDAQDGPDHVDAHRTIAYVVGPYVKQQGAVVSTRYTTVNMLRTIEDILGLEPMGLNDGLQGPMIDVFTHELKPWSYTPIVPDVLRTTQLPLPPPTAANTLLKTNRILAFAHTPHDASYWGEKLTGFDFTRSDHLDTARFNSVLWAGLKGENIPYPTTRSGRDLNKNRQRLLANYIREWEKEKKPSASTFAAPETSKHPDEPLR